MLTYKAMVVLTVATKEQTFSVTEADMHMHLQLGSQQETTSTFMR